MRRLILGTAGHIDHGKTALVKALTGVDTDRLKEEKERGITVDLGFAEYRPEPDVHFGVVDVPGHEGFIRNMLAGATGMDVVLLVVAADEGVMPQTREHLSIVRLLGVPALAVALTKVDLVDPDWLELVRDDVGELLSETPYRGAPVLPVSSVSREGLKDLGATLASLGREGEEKGARDVPRLPIDRVFTVRGAGTVVTGTLWTGTLRIGDRVQIRPGSLEARVRSLQHHGEEVGEAPAGARVAVGLSGAKISHQGLSRGQSVVGSSDWIVSKMLTCKLSVLQGTGWELEQGQRVRVHLGTAEVLARVALFQGERMGEGARGWAQLRLEAPLLARVRDHFVVRSYSPVTTIGGGRVVEVDPRKRRTLAPGEEALLEARLADSAKEGLRALVETSGWNGVAVVQLPQRTGYSPEALEGSVPALIEDGKAMAVEGRLFSASVWGIGETRLTSVLDAYHRKEPLKPGMPLEELRQSLPGGFGSKLAEALLQALSAEGKVRLRKGIGALEGFRPSLTPRQKSLRSSLREVIEGAGLAPPNLRELGEKLGGAGELESVLRLMESDGEVLALDPEIFFSTGAVRGAAETLVRELSGARDLGPADFREVLPVSRRHLLPLLRHFDTIGITTRRDDRREVTEDLPPDWPSPETTLI